MVSAALPCVHYVKEAKSRNISARCGKELLARNSGLFAIRKETRHHKTRLQGRAVDSYALLLWDRSQSEKAGDRFGLGFQPQEVCSPAIFIDLSKLPSKNVVMNIECLQHCLTESERTRFERDGFLLIVNALVNDR